MYALQLRQKIQACLTEEKKITPQLKLLIQFLNTELKNHPPQEAIPYSQFLAFVKAQQQESLFEKQKSDDTRLSNRLFLEWEENTNATSLSTNDKLISGEQQEKNLPISYLPNELLVYILSFLDIYSIIQFSLVQKLWGAVTKENNALHNAIQKTTATANITQSLNQLKNLPFNLLYPLVRGQLSYKKAHEIEEDLKKTSLERENKFFPQSVNLAPGLFPEGKATPTIVQALSENLVSVEELSTPPKSEGSSACLHMHTLFGSKLKNRFLIGVRDGLYTYTQLMMSREVLHFNSAGVLQALREKIVSFKQLASFTRQQATACSYLLASAHIRKALKQGVLDFQVLLKRSFPGDIFFMNPKVIQAIIDGKFSYTQYDTSPINRLALSILLTSRGENYLKSKNLMLSDVLGYQEKTGKRLSTDETPTHALCMLFEDTPERFKEGTNCVLLCFPFIQAINEKIITPQQAKKLYEKFSTREIFYSIFTLPIYIALKRKLITFENLMELESNPSDPFYLKFQDDVNKKFTSGSFPNEAPLLKIPDDHGHANEHAEEIIQFFEKFNRSFEQYSSPPRLTA